MAVQGAEETVSTKKKNKWTGSKRAFFRTSVLSEDVIGLWLWSFSEQTCGPELGMCFFPHVTGKKKKKALQIM